MAQRMQQRRDTAANWTSTNPVLAQGEIGVETDADPIVFKIGDGVTAWNFLGYAGGETGPGGPPTGAAGGVLNGSYPNPGFAADMATQAELDTLSTSTTSGLAAKADAAATTTALAGKAATSHAHSAADITSGTVAAARLGTGSAGAGALVLADNQTWITPAGTYTAENARDDVGAALVGTGGITVTPNDVANTITVDGSAITVYTAENARDDVGAALVGTGGITITPNDVANTITIDGAAISGYTDEQARDAIGVALIGSGGITVTPNDVANTITVDGSAVYTAENARDDVGAALVGTGGVTVTLNDVSNTITIDGLGTGTQDGGFGVKVAVMTGDITESANSFTNLTGLAFDVTAGHRYRASFFVPVRSASATSGPQFVFTAPTMTSAAINARIPRLAASADGLFETATTAMTSNIAGLDLPTANEDYLVEIVAVFQPAADGTIQLRGRAETSGQLMTFQSYGFGEILDYDDPLASNPEIPVPVFIRCADTDTTATTIGTNKGRIRMPFGYQLTEVRAGLTNAGGVTVDVNVSGISILSTKLTIDAGEKTSVTALVPAVISAAEIADDLEITVDVDAISGAPSGLKVWLIGIPDPLADVHPPPPETDLITDSFNGTAGNAVTLAATSADSLSGSGVLTFSDDFSTDGSGGLRIAGSSVSALRWEWASHAQHFAKWYYRHTVTPSSTAWFVYVYEADGTTVAFRIGVNSSGMFVIQVGTAGATDTTTVAAVTGQNYRFDLSVDTGPDTGRLAIYTLTGINATTEASALDVLTVTTTAAALSDELIGLNAVITGSGPTVAGNLVQEGFETPANGVQLTNLNTTASTHTGTGTITASTTYAAEGTKSMHVAGTATDFLSWAAATHTVHKASVYFRYVAASSGGNCYLYKVRDGANALDAFQLGIGTDGRLRIRNSNNGTPAIAVTAFVTNTNYRLDIEAAGGGAYTVKIYTGANINSTTTPVETVTMIGTITATNFGIIAVGNQATLTAAVDVYIDRVRVDNTALPTPIGVVSAVGVDAIFDHYMSDSAVMPANTFIEEQGGGNNQVSALLVPPDGKCWWGGHCTLRSGGGQTVDAGIDVWMTFSRRRPDIVHFYKTALNWNGVPTTGSTGEAICLDKAPGVRSIGLFNWKFATGTTWQAIAGGSNDANIRTWANGWANYPHKVFINLHHEWDRAATATGAMSWNNYAAAFRHIVDVYRAEIPSAERNLIFVWGPTGYSSNVGSNGSDYLAAWPGDAYVDWIAWDPYFQTTNRVDFGDFVTTGGVHRSLIQENVANTSGWTGMYIFATNPHTVGVNGLLYPFSGTKPLMIGEWGTWFATDPINGPDSEGDLTDNDAAVRIRSIGDQAPDYPAIKAIVHYNDDPMHNNHIDPVSSHPLAADAFGDVGELAYFNVGVQNAP